MRSRNAAVQGNDDEERDDARDGEADSRAIEGRAVEDGGNRSDGYESGRGAGF